MAPRIRFATPDDAAGILAIYAPFCDSTFVSFEIAAPTEAQMRERIQLIQPDYPWLVCEIDSQVAGYAYASRHRERAAYRWSVDVAVYVAEQNRGRNVGRALYTTLFEILRRQGYFKAYAGISLPNSASVGLHEAMGFRQVAVFRGEGFKLGAWRDVGWWELDLQPRVDEPAEPRPMRLVCNEPGIAAVLESGLRLLTPSEPAN
jgi:L-amino acid N-acyltransferase YncA